MEMLGNITDFESLENFPKNVYDEVCFNKIANLWCTICSSTITRVHRRFFLEYVQKSYIPGSTTEVSPRDFCKIALYKISEKFLRDICHSLFNNLAGRQSIG